MNNENGNVVVSDEKGNKTQREYYDNLDEILVKENLIETMKTRLKELEESRETYKRNIGKHYTPIILPMAVGVITIFAPILGGTSLGADMFKTYVDTIFGQMNFAAAVITSTSAAIIPPCIGLESFLYCDYRKKKKIKRGIESEIDFLKERIVKESEKLESLKQEKSIQDENPEFRVVKISNQSKALDRELNFYFDLGSNARKYYQYYEQGLLDKKLESTYSYPEIQLAKEYLEEKGPSLQLKNKNKK